MSYIGNTNTTQAFTPAIDYFSGNGSTTAFTLSRPVASVAQVQVVIDNVAQNPSSAYTVSSNTITFTSAPLSGTNNIYVYYTSPITQVIAPGQGTVSSTSLASSTGSGAVVLATSPTIATPTLTSPIITGSTPQITVYTSGSGTYTTPTNCRYLWVRIVGGGGGGASNGASGNNSGSGGGTSTFGSMSASGGGGAFYTATGGSASGGDINCVGGATGVPGNTSPQVNQGYGGPGGSSVFGGGGAGGTNGGAAGNAPPAGYGGGGGGCGTNSSYIAMAGGAGGGYSEKTYTSPSATYSYSVGAGGAGGTGGGTGGGVGGAGAAGVVIVVAYF